MSTTTRSVRPRWLFRSCLLAGSLAMVVSNTCTAGARPAGVRPAEVQAGNVEVTFDPQCTSADVLAEKPLGAIEIVFDGGEKERVTRLVQPLSFRVRMAPVAVAAGHSIARLSVVASDSADATINPSSFAQTTLVFSCYSARAPGS